MPEIFSSQSLHCSRPSQFEQAAQISHEVTFCDEKQTLWQFEHVLRLTFLALEEKCPIVISPNLDGVLKQWIWLDLLR